LLYSTPKKARDLLVVFGCVGAAGSLRFQLKERALKNFTRAIVVASAVAVCATAASASVQYDFYGITSNSFANVTAGVAQLRMTVSPVGADAEFLFENIGTTPMSITDVYFDDGSLLQLATVIDGAGVDFAQNAAPPNLPGANNASPPFQITAGFSADANPPAQPNGVNPGEWLKIIFTLQSGQTIADVYAELADGRLRTGLHVQGFSNGGSESFVNNVPAPAGLSLLGLAGLAAVRRRR